MVRLSKYCCILGRQAESSFKLVYEFVWGWEGYCIVTLYGHHVGANSIENECEAVYQLTLCKLKYFSRSNLRCRPDPSCGHKMSALVVLHIDPWLPWRCHAWWSRFVCNSFWSFGMSTSIKLLQSGSAAQASSCSSPLNFKILIELLQQLLVQDW